MFKWKYPLWYGKNICLKDCILFEIARAGIWHTDNITVEDTMIEAPKSFRRCHGTAMENVTMANVSETLWSCDNVAMENVTAKGDYFARNSNNMKINNFQLFGNYSFDGCKNIEILLL